jgi:hypothetical protein
MLISNNRRSPLQWTFSATGYVLAVSCAGTPSPITADLLSGNQVCLAMDWGSAPRPNFFGWTPPDTMLLLPKISENRWEALQADAEGLVGVVASQPDRKGGGWIWWTRSDTLWISSQSPTMDDLMIEAVRPIGRSRVSWKGTGMSTDRRGHLDLQTYPCGGLSESSP